MSRFGFTIFFLTILSPAAHAFDWHDWFLTSDQQAERAMQTNQHERAAKLFTSPEWQGTAHYRANDFNNALECYSASESALAAYNRGNALAKLGDYQGAINAYEEALAKQPDFADATFNKKLLENLPQKKPPPPQDQQQQNQSSSTQQQQPSNSKSQQQSQSDEQQKSNPQKKPQPSEHADKKQKTKSSSSSSPQDESTQKTLSKQQQQAQNKRIDQALRTIPDDPGGLLKQKFRRDHRRKLQESF